MRADEAGHGEAVGAADRTPVSIPGRSADSTDWPPGIIGLSGVAGTVGMFLVVWASLVLGPHGPTGSSVEHAVLHLAPSGALGSAAAIAAYVLGLALLIGAWLVVGLLLRRGAPLQPLRRLAIAWAAPLVVGPPLFSRDVYSYAAQGLMVHRHIDPYQFGPAALTGPTHFLAPVSGIWMHTASPYGPVFLRLADLAVRLSGGTVLSTVLILRAFEIGGVVLIAYALPKLATAVGRDPARALWLGVLNPLVLFHFIGGAHNDALMVGLLVAGLAAAAMRRPVTGILLCTLAATIKVPAAIAIVFIVAEVVRAATPERRLAVAARLSVISFSAFTAITLVTRMGTGWITALGVPGTNRSLLTPTTFVAHWISFVVGHDAAVLTLSRLAGTACAAAGVAYLVWRAPRLGTARACGLALAVVVAFGPIILPWYALWGMIVLAAAGRRIERGFAIFASVILLLTVEPSGSAMPDVVLMLAVLTLSAVALAIAWHPVRRWIRHDLADAIDHYRGGDIARLSTAVRRALPIASDEP